MKFLVDEMPCFGEDCPFNKVEWDNDMWVEYCSLNKRECNLHEKESECHGLKELSTEAV